MQSVNESQFLNTTFLLSLFGLSLSCAAATVTVPVTSIYVSL